MTNKLLLILLIAILFTTLGYSQKVKFRIDVGNSVNFSSYRPKLFMKDYQEQIPSSEYTYKKMARNGLLKIPTSIALSLEFDYKDKNHFTIGFTQREIISIKDRIIFNNSIFGKDSLGYNSAAPWSSSEDSEIPLYKVSMQYSRDFGKGILRFSPLIGISYAWVGGSPSPYEFVGESLALYGEDSMFPSSDFYVNGLTNFTNSTSTLMGSIGVNFRFHSKKRELFAIKLYYEQGFRPMVQKQTIVYRNGNKFAYNMIYSYGSALYVKVSIPIPVYNFVDHKWGK